MEKTGTVYPEEIISAGQLLRILDSDAREISALCQRACLKPKKDGFGNIYFSKGDVDVLRKVKELYEHTRKIQEEKKNPSAAPVRENKLKKLKEEKIVKPVLEEKNNGPFIKENNLPVRAEKFDMPAVSGAASVMRKIDSMENNVITKITDVLSEKLDGLDEVIVELIKAKTENETLRQKINELNKENFALKSEVSSFRPVALGLYVKKSTDEFTF